MRVGAMTTDKLSALVLNRKPGGVNMPKFNDPDLDQRKEDLSTQINELKKQMAEVPPGQDMSGLQAQLDQLQTQRREVQLQRKAAREQNRADWLASGKGKGQPEEQA